MLSGQNDGNRSETHSY